MPFITSTFWIFALHTNNVSLTNYNILTSTIFRPTFTSSNICFLTVCPPILDRPPIAIRIKNEANGSPCLRLFVGRIHELGYR